jgi:uncharacterized protein (TIGR02246 family)
MKTIIAAIAVFISMSAISYSVAVSAKKLPAPGDHAQDEAAIHKVVGRVQEGWNKGDGKGFAASFAEDADYVIVNGIRVKGRDVIAAGHQRIFDTIYKNSRNTATVQSIRFLRDDVALVHIEWHLKLSQDEPAREHKAMNSMVMTKDNGQWSVAAFHNTPITATQK